MKQFLVFFGAVILVFGIAGPGGAGPLPITFTDTTMFYDDGTDPNVDLVDYDGDYVNKLEHIADFVTWTHHFDFSPPVGEVLSGELTLWLEDDEPDTWPPRTWEFGIGGAEDGSWDIGGVDTGTYSYNVTASYLIDGMFTITLASLWGDFAINQSDLTITYNTPVPEPATILLMGTGLVGLVGLAGLGRKKLLRK